MAPNDTTTVPNGAKYPEWLDATFFDDLLKRQFGAGYKVTKFNPIAAFGGGENYASDMLRVEIDLELKDGKSKSTSYILKMLPQSEVGAAVVNQMNLFPKEMGMYGEILPKFEKLYADVGKNVVFGPKCYAVSNKHGGEIVMEDLKEQNFKNAKRQIGLDMAHTKRVLEKLAQFHAASACLYEKNGRYATMFETGFYNEDVRETFEKMNESTSKLFRDCLIKKYKNGEKYVEKMQKFSDSFIDIIKEATEINEENFNVLNHGDLWCNNIMFQYEEQDPATINQLYFVDFQLSKYGSPSNDLYYFLISSTCYENRISQFDYFIKYYHDKLSENLKLLGYPKRIPLLREIHIQLLKDKFWGIGTATGVMTAVLLDPTEDASIENFLETSDEGVRFKMNAFLNPRYVRAMEALFPFFDNRGLLDF